MSAVPIVQGKGNENRNRVIPILNDRHQIMVSRMNAMTNIIEPQTDYMDRFSAMPYCRANCKTRSMFACAAVEGS